MRAGRGVREQDAVLAVQAVNWWPWLLLAWPLSGQLAWLRMGKSHSSWHVNWKSRLGLAILLALIAFACAALGPIALWAIRRHDYAYVGLGGHS